MFSKSDVEARFHKLDGVPDERRRRRRPVRGLALTNPVRGRVIDITGDGLGLECHHPLRIHGCYPLTLSAGSSRKTHRQGEVRWCRLMATTESSTGEPTLVYRVGIAFCDS